MPPKNHTSYNKDTIHGLGSVAIADYKIAVNYWPFSNQFHYLSNEKLDAFAYIAMGVITRMQDKIFCK